MNSESAVTVTDIVACNYSPSPVQCSLHLPFTSLGSFLTAKPLTCNISKLVFTAVFPSTALYSSADRSSSHLMEKCQQSQFISGNSGIQFQFPCISEFLFYEKEAKMYTSSLEHYVKHFENWKELFKHVLKPEEPLLFQSALTDTQGLKRCILDNWQALQNFSLDSHSETQTFITFIIISPVYKPNLEFRNSLDLSRIENVRSSENKQQQKQWSVKAKKLAPMSKNPELIPSTGLKMHSNKTSTLDYSTQWIFTPLTHSLMHSQKALRQRSMTNLLIGLGKQVCGEFLTFQTVYCQNLSLSQQRQKQSFRRHWKTDLYKKQVQVITPNICTINKLKITIYQPYYTI